MSLLERLFCSLQELCKFWIADFDEDWLDHFERFRQFELRLPSRGGILDIRQYA